MTIRRQGGFVALVLLALVGGARADEDALARARTHYKAGEALYNLHNYTDAIREFSAGYALAPRPEFLLNLGQAYRMRDRDDDLEKAREMYRKYLEQAPPDDRNRRNVTQVLDEIEKKIAARPAPPPKPPEPPPTGTATGTAMGTTGSAAVPAAALTAEAPPPVEKRSSKAGVVVGVIVAVVVVAAAVGLGVYFGTRSAVDCNAVSLGCIDATK